MCFTFLVQLICIGTVCSFIFYPVSFFAIKEGINLQFFVCHLSNLHFPLFLIGKCKDLNSRQSPLSRSATFGRTHSFTGSLLRILAVLCIVRLVRGTPLLETAVKQVNFRAHYHLLGGGD